MDHVSKAVQYFEKGFMCSQAVFASFAEQFGITEKQALQIGACFGGGMRRLRYAVRVLVHLWCLV